MVVQGDYAAKDSNSIADNLKLAAGYSTHYLIIYDLPDRLVGRRLKISDEFFGSGRFVHCMSERRNRKNGKLAPEIFNLRQHSRYPPCEVKLPESNRQRHYRILLPGDHPFPQRVEGNGRIGQ